MDKGTISAVILHGLLALAGGITKNVTRIEKKGFKVITFVTDLVAGAFTGVLTGFICLQAGLPNYTTWFLVSVAGMLGESLLTVFRKIVKEKMSKIITKYVPDEPDDKRNKGKGVVKNGK